MIKRIIFLMIMVGISLFVNATNYYVSTTGNDLLDGKSPGSAWKTLSKVGGYTSYNPGDSILLKRGEVWREMLNFPVSGTAASKITLGGYGTSTLKPKILGSYTSTWLLSSGNVWVSATTFSNPRTDFPADVYFVKSDGTVIHGIYKSNTTSLTSEYNWTWSNNNIYVYSATDPDIRYSIIEVPQRRACIDTKNREYININGVDLFYAQFQGISYDWSLDQVEMFNATIENCEIAHIGGDITNFGNEEGYGIDVGYTNMVIRKCEIHDCGRRAISLHIYGRGFTIKNILIEDNKFYNGHHTTGPDLSVGSSSSYTTSIDGVIIRRNIIYDSSTASGWSEGIFLQNYMYNSTTTFLRNVYIYSNIFICPIANSINMEGTQGVYVYNNTFYNHNNDASDRAHIWVDNNNALVRIKNNIFYTTSTNDIGGMEVFIRSGQNLSAIDANYNLYYRVNNTLRIMNKENLGTYYMNDISRIRLELGLEKNSPTPSDPMFVSSSDYHLKVGSPALNSGVTIPEVTMDYAGNSFGKEYEIGAYSDFGDIGIDTIEDLHNILLVYPNPVQDLVSIIFKDGTTMMDRFEIYDIIGKKILVYYTSGSSGVKDFNLNLGKGIYLIRVYGENNLVIIVKLIKL